MILDKTKLTREIVHALRHAPESLGLELDSDGSVSWEDLHQGILDYTEYDIDPQSLRESVAECNRNRLVISDAGVAAKGDHSTNQIEYTLAEPPEHLYYTCTQKYAPQLMDRGLFTRRNNYLKVYASPLAAHADARRRRIKNGLIVTIKAEMAYHDGTLFYKHGKDWYIQCVENPFLSVQEEEDPTE